MVLFISLFTLITSSKGLDSDLLLLLLLLFKSKLRVPKVAGYKIQICKLSPYMTFFSYFTQ
jgi:hypothetical protein